jgi:DNA polymerase-4
LDRIDGTNLESVFDKLSLLDLPGINYRYQARLNLAGIYSGRDFLNASLDKLQKEVFRGINGYYWYLRLRGYEIDTINFNRKSFGAQYTLAQKTTDLDQLARILMKLSEKVGRRMRAKGYSGQGIKLFLKLIDGTVVMKHSHPGYQLYATPDIYQVVFSLLNLILLGQPVRELGVSVYGLNSIQLAQQSLFGNTYNSIKIAQAMDAINDKYGEYKITMALMANMKDVIIKRVAFGKNDQ